MVPSTAGKGAVWREPTARDDRIPRCGSGPLPAGDAGRGGRVLGYGQRLPTLDHTGDKIAEAGRDGESVVIATVDLDAAARYRRTWGVFRDRRPEHYAAIGALAGAGDRG